MTQYQTSFDDPHAQQSAGPKPTSGLSITALVFSLIGIIPCLGLLTAPIGFLLGIGAFFTTGPSAPKKGRGMAVTAIVLGLALGGGQAYATKKGWDFFYGFYALVMNGPDEALRTGSSGDLAAFKAGFHGAGATASDAEAKAFLDELQKRYGTFQSCAFDKSSGQAPKGAQDKPVVPFPYVLTFSNQTIKAEAEVVFVDEATGTILKKFGYIKVMDDTNGNLMYPASRGETGSPPSDTNGEKPPTESSGDASKSDGEPPSNGG